jgi:hypothetical protein
MKRREFITLLGGARQRGRPSRTRSSPNACGASIYGYTPFCNGPVMSSLPE